MFIRWEDWQEEENYVETEGRKTRVRKNWLPEHPREKVSEEPSTALLTCQRRI